MLLLHIDKSSSNPIFKQVASELQKLIDEGVLKEGDKLPSTRRLAGQLGINRTTICKAFDELWSLGYIESRSGSYSYVRNPRLHMKGNASEKTSVINWEKQLNPISYELNDRLNTYKTDINSNLIDFHSLSPDPKHIPWEQLRKSMNTAIYSMHEHIFIYGDYKGFLPFRKTIANQMQKHGIKVNAEEILITNGTQNSLDLLLKVLLKPGDKVVVENPTYKWASALFRLHHAEIISVPQTNDGIDLINLEQTLRKNKVAFIYTMTNFHNPTSISTNQIHREKLLGICEKYKVPLVEDGFEEEMKYFSKAIMPIKAMDKNQVVIYLGTFSKVLAPGVRTGWIVADEACINNLSNVKAVSDLGTNTPIQAALNEFILSGQYDRHLYKMHKIYRKRMNHTLKCIRNRLRSSSVDYVKPIGGYTLWFSCRSIKISEKDLLKRILQNGVMVTPGSQYYEKPSDDIHFRISIAHTNETEIETGIDLIAEVLNTI